MYINTKVVYDNRIYMINTWIDLYLHLIEVFIPGL